MQSFRVETKLPNDHTLVLEGLPFQAGETVEVIILSLEPAHPVADRYPFRGLPVTYLNPFEPVAEEDWESAQ